MNILSNVWVQEGNILLDRIQDHIDNMNYAELIEWSSSIDLDEAPVLLRVKILQAMIDKSPVVNELRSKYG